MTRFAPETPPPRPAAEEEECHDSLFDRWLTHATASRPRLRSGVPSNPTPEPDATLGDELADAWFRRFK